jgi:hypothetical protein
MATLSVPKTRSYLERPKTAVTEVSLFNIKTKWDSRLAASFVKRSIQEVWGLRLVKMKGCDVNIMKGLEFMYVLPRAAYSR